MLNTTKHFAYLVNFVFHLCNNNQRDALFILYFSVVQPLHVSGIFIAIIRRYTVYIQLVRVLLFSWPWPTDSQLKNTTRTNCCIYTVYLLMMGYNYAQNMYRLNDGTKLRLNSASSWFLLQKCIAMHGQQNIKFLSHVVLAMNGECFRTEH